MTAEVVYTDTYKITLIAVINYVENNYGASSAGKLLDRIDRIVKKSLQTQISTRLSRWMHDTEGLLFPANLHWFMR
ncbi:hypothetical protein [Mucilaginibacter sp.]|uniref:hypothetical protein n=1 Tax=Mucilaginibacter sp. TaxID=1882438 RepID=UPI0026053047|nr:hypothetical protein [Mucilaginibacter sp.]MDB5030056.1 hypothetical protein [Mucilaginibacter sp.]